MVKHVEYKTKGVCSQMIIFDLDDGIVKNVQFIRGCRGNTQGVAALAEGMEAREVIKRLKGIPCREDGNSCPNQFAIALEQTLAENQ